MAPWKAISNSKEFAGSFVAVVIAVLLLGYSGWVLFDDVRSYGYEPAHPTSHQMAVGYGSGKAGSPVNFSYSFTAGDGRSYTGTRLFATDDERVSLVTEGVLERWYARWASDPVVYYDASDPTRSRAVIGLTASLSSVAIPTVLILGCWLVMRRRERSRYAHGPIRSYSNVAAVGGLAGVFIAGTCVQAIYFTRCWVEHGWIVHAALLAGAVVGMVAAVRYSKAATQRWLDELQGERHDRARRWREAPAEALEGGSMVSPTPIPPSTGPEVHAIVLASLHRDFVTVILSPGMGLADGGIHVDVPIELVPPQLRMPNTCLWVRLKPKGMGIESVRLRGDDQDER